MRVVARTRLVASRVDTMLVCLRSTTRSAVGITAMKKTTTVAARSMFNARMDTTLIAARMDTTLIAARVDTTLGETTTIVMRGTAALITRSSATTAAWAAVQVQCNRTIVLW